LFAWQLQFSKPRHQRLKDGLGEKKLTFPKDGNVAEAHEVIVSAFLALGEGYEILRTMEGRSK